MDRAINNPLATFDDVVTAPKIKDGIVFRANQLIYVATLNDQVLYVGSTTRGRKRLSEHLRANSRTSFGRYLKKYEVESDRLRFHIKYCRGMGDGELRRKEHALEGRLKPTCATWHVRRLGVRPPGNVCAAPGCPNRFEQSPGRGRPRQYCSARCRVATYRARQRDRQHLDPSGHKRPPIEVEEAPAGAPAVFEALSAALSALKRQVASLQARVDELTRELVDAHDRATAAETEARLLRAGREARRTAVEAARARAATAEARLAQAERANQNRRKAGNLRRITPGEAGRENRRAPSRNRDEASVQ